MTIQEYSRQAIERAEARHAANGHDMLACFHHNGSAWVVYVMRQVVLVTKSMHKVETFCAMHNRVF